MRSGSDLKTRLESLKWNLDLTETILGSIIALETLVFFFRGLIWLARKAAYASEYTSLLPNGIVSSFPNLT
jgi:hypothetical protein